MISFVVVFFAGVLDSQTEKIIYAVQRLDECPDLSKLIAAIVPFKNTASWGSIFQ